MQQIGIFQLFEIAVNGFIVNGTTLGFQVIRNRLGRKRVADIIIFKIVDFPQRRTPVRIFTKGVSVYAIIWFTYKGLSIIGIASYLG